MHLWSKSCERLERSSFARAITRRHSCTLKQTRMVYQPHERFEALTDLPVVHGRTLNPFNRRLSPGGSSGGEGALVGFRGSPIGLGADGGGSIRSPAANNGLFGMKQTSGRVPLRGCTLSMTGCTSFPVVVGPICRSARDNDYFLKTIISAEPSRTEQDLVPLPWRPVSFDGKIKIGIMADDGVVRPHPPVLAAVEATKKVLAAHPDFDLADWTPWRHDEGYDIVRQLYFQDGGAENYSIMDETGEPPLPLSDWVMKESHTKKLTIAEAWVLNDKRDTFRSELLPSIAIINHVY